MRLVCIYYSFASFNVPQNFLTTEEERRVQLNGLHGIISQKTILFITTAVKTSNPTSSLFPVHGVLLNAAF
jgi:hypothetical protein